MLWVAVMWVQYSKSRHRAAGIHSVVSEIRTASFPPDTQKIRNTSTFHTTNYTRSYLIWRPWSQHWEPPSVLWRHTHRTYPKIPSGNLTVGLSQLHKGHMLTEIANEPLVICERIKAGSLIHDQEEMWAIPPLHADLRTSKSKFTAVKSQHFSLSVPVNTPVGGELASNYGWKTVPVHETCCC